MVSVSICQNLTPISDFRKYFLKREFSIKEESKDI